MGRALVTGATGFIGFHLVEHLTQRGEEVRCFVRQGSNRSAIERFAPEFFQGNLHDPSSLRRAIDGVDVVYHLAGATKCFSRAEFKRANVDAVRCLADACAARTTPPRLVHVSSLAAAGASTAGNPRIESDTENPVSEYGRSKLRGEHILREYADRVPITIARPPLVAGPGDHDGFLLFDSIARFGLHLIPASETNECSFISAAELAQALRSLSAKGKPLGSDPTDDTGIYFVANPESKTFADYGREIGQVLGRDHIRVVAVPTWMIWCVAAANEAWGRIRRRQHILNFDKVREAEAGCWTCSPEKLNREVGFSFAEPLRTTLEKSIEWYVQAGWMRPQAERPTRAELQ